MTYIPPSQPKSTVEISSHRDVKTIQSPPKTNVETVALNILERFINAMNRFRGKNNWIKADSEGNAYYNVSKLKEVLGGKKSDIREVFNNKLLQAKDAAEFAKLRGKLLKDPAVGPDLTRVEQSKEFKELSNSMLLLLPDEDKFNTKMHYFIKFTFGREPTPSDYTNVIKTLVNSWVDQKYDLPKLRQAFVSSPKAPNGSFDSILTLLDTKLAIVAAHPRRERFHRLKIQEKSENASTSNPLPLGVSKALRETAVSDPKLNKIIDQNKHAPNVSEALSDFLGIRSDYLAGPKSIERSSEGGYTEKFDFLIHNKKFSEFSKKMIPLISDPEQFRSKLFQSIQFIFAAENIGSEEINDTLDALVYCWKNNNENIDELKKNVSDTFDRNTKIAEQCESYDGGEGQELFTLITAENTMLRTLKGIFELPARPYLNA